MRGLEWMGLFYYLIPLFKWPLFPAYLQVVAILGTGVAAIAVANRQLQQYVVALKTKNAQERIRLALSLFEEIYREVTINGERLSPWTADDVLQSAQGRQD